MIPVSEWLPPAAVGSVFTTLGMLKVYGFSQGIVGGGGKPATCRLMGRCPSWSPAVNKLVVALFLGIGLYNLLELSRVLRSY